MVRADYGLKDYRLEDYKKSSNLPIFQSSNFLSGVTLIELVVVLAIICMLAGMGVAILVNASKDLGVRAATNAVVSLIRYAVTTAKSTESPTAVVINIQERNIYMLPLETVSLWHFEDKTPRSATGTTSGAFEQKGRVYGADLVYGKIGMSLRFDGADYVECGDVIPLYEQNQGVAVDMWLYTEVQGGEQMIFYKGEREPSLSLRLVRNRLEGRIGKLVLSSGNLPIPLNQWLHVTMVYSRGEGRLFVNGTEVASQQRNEKWLSKEPLIIGAVKDNTNRGRDGFRGIVDEFRISVIIPQRRYNLPNNVDFVIPGVANPPPRQQSSSPPTVGTQASSSPTPSPQIPLFVINFDAQGRLDIRYHQRPITFKVSSEAESKTIDIDLNGGVK